MSRAMQKPNRRGAVLVVVLVCLAVLMVLLVSSVRLAASGHQAMQRQARRLQADWLAESGLQRAAWQLGRAADYSGETWNVSAEQLGTPDSAVVTIEVEPVTDRPDQRLVRAVADYPKNSRRRVRQRRQVIVEITPPKGESP